MTMSQFHVSPYINFGGRAAEALEFYHQVLGGKLDQQAKRLVTDGGVIIGVDGRPDYPAKVGENMAVAIRGADRDGMAKIFGGLAEGGKVKGKLEKREWGGETGYLEDKFGINWIVSVEAS
jgi:PhnB protein